MLAIRGRNAYFYRSERIGPKVRRRYEAAGPFAVLMAAAAAETKGREDALRAEKRARSEAGRKAEEKVRRSLASSLAGVSAILAGMGFHRHDRGRWRRRRGMGDAIATRADIAMSEEAVRLDLARTAEDVFLDRESGKDRHFEARMRADLNHVRADLLGPEPNAIERMMADRVVLCYLEVHSLDLVTKKDDDVRLKRRERAERRYLAALRALAQVRRLRLPEMTFAGPTLVAVKG